MSKLWIRKLASVFALIFASPAVFAAGDVAMKIPALDIPFSLFGTEYSGRSLLEAGFVIIILGLLFGIYEFIKIKKLPAHKSMLEVSSLIYETCKTYMIQQGKLLALLQILVGAAIFWYFYSLRDLSLGTTSLILFWSVVGILGSYGVAWFGIRINTYANSRTAFSSLKGGAFSVMDIPLKAGMSIGVLLICVELLLMLAILLFVPSEYAGACFIGFAIGESLGASALRICGGI
jgi:K(+)-stimulated pyrophosphate-energized sodium pump